MLQLFFITADIYDIHIYEYLYMHDQQEVHKLRMCDPKRSILLVTNVNMNATILLTYKDNIMCATGKAHSLNNNGNWNLRFLNLLFHLSKRIVCGCVWGVGVSQRKHMYIHTYRKKKIRNTCDDVQHVAWLRLLSVYLCKDVNQKRFSKLIFNYSFKCSSILAEQK